MKKIFFLSGIIFLICIFSLLAIFVYIDRAAAFFINEFTDYNIRCDRWGNGLFDRSELSGVIVSSKNGDINIKSEQVKLNIEPRTLIEDRCLVVGCSLEGASLSIKMAAVDMDNDIFEALLTEDNIYEKVQFTLTLDKGLLKIEDFKAMSSQIKIDGDYIHYKERDEIVVDIKISFSPKMSGTFDEDIRNRVLSLDDDGWYSTIISYKGNPVFLKAIYAFTMASPAVK